MKTLLLFLFVSCSPQKKPEIYGPCETFREPTAYMIWIDGCYQGSYNLVMAFARTKPNTYQISEFCSALWKGRK